MRWLLIGMGMLAGCATGGGPLNGCQPVEGGLVVGRDMGMVIVAPLYICPEEWLRRPTP